MISNNVIWGPSPTKAGYNKFDLPYSFESNSFDASCLYCELIARLWVFCTFIATVFGNSGDKRVRKTLSLMTEQIL